MPELKEELPAAPKPPVLVEPTSTKAVTGAFIGALLIAFTGWPAAMAVVGERSVTRTLEWIASFEGAAWIAAVLLIVATVGGLLQIAWSHAEKVIAARSAKNRDAIVKTPEVKALLAAGVPKETLAQVDGKITEATVVDLTLRQDLGLLEPGPARSNGIGNGVLAILILPLAMMLAGCGGAGTAVNSSSPPPILAPAAELIAPGVVKTGEGVLLRGAQAMLVAELAYQQAAKVAIIGLESGIIRGEAAERLRVLNQRATAALVVGKAAVDAGDTVLSAAQAASIFDLVAQLTALRR